MKGTAASDSTLLITVGRPNSPLCAGSGGFARTMPALALQAVEQRGLLAADVGPGPDPQLQPERMPRAADPRPEPPRASRPQRSPRRAPTVAFGYSERSRCSPASPRPRTPAIAMPSISTKGSPSMIMRSAKVPLSPSSALQTMYFCAAAVVRHRLPLDPGREPGAAAPAQARRRHLVDRRLRPDLDRPREPLPAAVRRIVVERHRIGDAAARERQPRLPREERDRLDRPDRPRMPAARSRRRPPR